MTPLERIKYTSLFLLVLTISITILLYPSIIATIGGLKVKRMEIVLGITLPYGKQFLTLLTFILLLNLYPLTFYTYKSSKIKETMFRNSAPLLRDAASLIKPGLTFPKLLEELTKRDYGPLNYYIERVYMLSLSGYDFPEAFGKGMKGVPSSILRYLQVLVEAYLSGGKAAEVLGEASKFFLEFYSFEEMRERTLKAYIYIVAMAILIFLISITLILFFSQTLVSAGGGAPMARVLTDEEIIAIAFYTSIIISVFGGLMLGKIIKGEISGGIHYTYLFMCLSLIYILFSDEVVRFLSGFIRTP